VFVNPIELQKFISSKKIDSIGLYGSRLTNSPRIKTPQSKYFVNGDLWPFDYYPKYVSGGGFVMTGKTAQLLYKGNFL
jgi:hypothetical protein